MPHTIFVEFDGTVFVNKTMTEEAIKQAIIDFIDSLGTSAKVAHVDVVFDSDSQLCVTSVVVGVVCEDNTAQSITAAINQIGNGDECGAVAAVLCRITKAVVQPTQPPDHSQTTTTLRALLICVVVCVLR